MPKRKRAATKPKRIPTTRSALLMPHPEGATVKEVILRFAAFGGRDADLAAAAGVAKAQFAKWLRQGRAYNAAVLERAAHRDEGKDGPAPQPILNHEDYGALVTDLLAVRAKLKLQVLGFIQRQAQKNQRAAEMLLAYLENRERDFSRVPHPNEFVDDTDSDETPSTAGIRTAVLVLPDDGRDPNLRALTIDVKPKE